MNPRDDLEAALRSSANAAAHTPDRSFVDALEQRLLTAETGPKVVPLARRARRLGVATTAAIAFTVAGVAAAAGIVVTHPFADDAPGAPVSSEVPSSTEVATTDVPATTSTVAESSTTTEPAATVTSTIVPTTTEPATTTPATIVPVTAPPVTVPRTTPPTTSPPTTAAPITTTTEVQVPATLTINCTPNATTVVCRWSGTVPSGAATYAILRGDLSNGGPGRVFMVPIGTNSWTDPMAVEGVQYSYLVHVFDANGASLGHSNAAIISCC